jgi:hypothetical protein
MTLKFSTVTFCRPVASSSADFGCETAARASECMHIASSRISRGAKQAASANCLVLIWCVCRRIYRRVHRPGLSFLSCSTAGWLADEISAPDAAQPRRGQTHSATSVGRSGADSEFKRRQQPAIQMSYKPTAGRLACAPSAFFIITKETFVIEKVDSFSE